MTTTFEPTRIHVSLPRRTVFAVPDAAGVAIECRSGSVWITLDHDRRDIVLAAGERFDGDVHRRALVSALDSACIAVSSDRPIVLPLPPAAEPAPRAAWSWRAVTHGMTPA
jgi:hypothetical protein